MAVIGTLKPSTYILGIIFFIGIILGGMGLIAELRGTDSTFMSDSQTASFNATFNRYDTLRTSVAGLESSTSNSGNSWGVLGALSALVGSAWNTLVLLWTSFGFMNSVFSGLTMFGVPGWVGILMGLAVVVIIAFAIMSAIFGQEV